MKRILAFFILSFFICITSIAETNYLNQKIVLFPIQETKLAPIVNSTIKKFNYRVGETFQEGKDLVVLDKELYKQSFLKAKARLKKARESYKYSKMVVKNNKSLYKQNAVGEKELRKSKLERARALAEREQAKANYQTSKKKLEACSIEAPFPGRIIEKIKNEHDYVRTGQPIIKIANDKKLLAAMHLPAEKITEVEIGTELKFKIDETNTTCKGKVYSIAGAIDPGSRTVEIKAIIDNKDRELRSGMSGTLITEI